MTCRAAAFVDSDEIPEVLVREARQQPELEAEAAGAAAVLRKPVTLEVLLSAVDHCLKAV